MNDAEFLHQFESATLPRKAWTHRAHVRIAYLYLSSHPLVKAIDMMRIGIKRLNKAHSTPETPTRGYNETTTVAFMHLIAAAMQLYQKALPTSDSEPFCNEHPHLMNPTILRQFYSPGRQMDPKGKTEFLEPDLASLPELDSPG